MPLERLQCQSCGAPLAAAGGSRFVACDHCGARLRVVESATGVLSTTIDTMGVDAAIRAREEECARLERDIGELAKLRASADTDRQKEQASVAFTVSCLTRVVLLGGLTIMFLICLISDVSSPARSNAANVKNLLAVTSALAIFVVIWIGLTVVRGRLARRMQAGIDAKFSPRVAEIDARVQASRVSLSGLRKQIAELRSRLRSKFIT